LAERLSYEESCRLLQERGFLDQGSIPPLPAQMPSPGDDGPLGVSFFRTGVWEDALDNLTLPRTFFGRSEVSEISFRNTDLSESWLCWNDFIEVDFTEANLSRCDLRASLFQEVKFVRTDLSGTDLCQSEFTDCDFTEANMQKTRLTRGQGDELRLSDVQRREIDWQEEEGEEPAGG
jgi:BTB/POZ domain-containing protein KCTD9